MKYEVFARLNAGDDLLNIGTVDADTDRLARTYAKSTYDEEDWDRLVVVRQEYLLEVKGDQRPDAPSAGGDA